MSKPNSRNSHPRKGGGKYEARTPAKVHTGKPCVYDKMQSNDVSYYNKNATDYALATRIPWIAFAGDKIRFNDVFVDDVASDWPSMPGIATIDYYHGPGYAALSDDAVNRAFTVLQGHLFTKTAANQIAFGRDDLARFTIGQTSTSSLLASAKRTLESVGFWVNRNYAYPKAIIKAQGFDYDEVVANYPSYKIRLNQLIQAYNNLKVPSFIDTFKRQYALAHNIYLDEDSPLGQIYLWKPANYYVYDDVNSTLVSYDMPESFSSFDEYLDIIDATIKAWYGSDDLYLINGTLQRVFPESEFVAVAEFNDESIEPIVDNVMMLQLMNATITGPLENLNVTGDPVTQTIFWQPRTQSIRPQMKSFFLRAYNGDPTADENMEMTRFTAFWTHHVINNDDISSTVVTEYSNCSPELIKNMKFWAVNRRSDGSVTLKQLGVLNSNFIYRVTGTYLLDDVATIIGAQPFRYLPPVFIVEALDGMQGDGLAVVYGMLGDQYNYTYLSKEAWNDLQKVAMFSLYSVPQVTPGLNI